MANTCFTTYICTGSEEELKDLYQKMTDLQNVKDYHQEIGHYGKTWLGNLVNLLGGKVDGEDGVFCRGEWTYLNYDDAENRLNINTETAWSEMDQFRHFIEQRYETIKIWYMSEESGMGEYCTNDAEGEFFPYRYVIDISSSNPDLEYMEFKTSEEARAKIEETIGRKLNDEEDLNDALDEWADENEIEYAGYHEFKVVDD